MPRVIMGRVRVRHHALSAEARTAPTKGSLPAAAAELQDALVAEQSQGAQHGVGVHPQDGREVPGGSQPLEAPGLASRLHKRWPLATFQIRGLRNQPRGSRP